MLYIGCPETLPERSTPELSVESVEESRRIVAQWFSQPAVQFVGAHTGCSCGFPSVVALTAIEYYDGMWADAGDRADDLSSVSALIQLLRGALTAGQPVELYPVWDGDEAETPRGTIHLSLEDLDPETFFFNERFKYVVRRTRETA